MLDNGFYGKQKFAGEAAWKHTGMSYVESMAGIGTAAEFTVEEDIEFLDWLANASAAHPNRTLVGHGSINVNKSAVAVAVAAASAASARAGAAAAPMDPEFLFGLAKYLL